MVYWLLKWHNLRAHEGEGHLNAVYPPLNVKRLKASRELSDMNPAVVRQYPEYI